MNYFQIGLCTTYNKVQSKIVLAGDPKQLDAVCKSTTAAELGYKISFLERLFKKPLYSRHPTNNAYNPKYITQLIKNYRSYVAILHTPNRLYYDDTLEAKAPEGLFNYMNSQSKFIFKFFPFLNFYFNLDQTHWLIGSEILQNSDKSFPIIFKSVIDSCSRIKNDMR